MDKDFIAPYVSQFSYDQLSTLLVFFFSEQRPDQKPSFWDDVNGEKVIITDADIEENFKRKEAKAASEKEEAETVMVKSVLEPQKHKAISVMLPKLPETIDKLKKGKSNL